METIKGLKLDKFLLKDLKKVADLIYFDGPLLSHFKNRYNDSYLYYWCDTGERYHRWLIFRVADEHLNLYLTRQLTLRELICDPIDGFLYAVDIDDMLQYKNTYIIRPIDLPASYLPEADSYYEFEPTFLDSEGEKVSA